MIKELTHDPIFLSLKSEIATKEDLQVAEDLLDTLTAHKDGCVGKRKFTAIKLVPKQLYA
jgi:peptide deformylase